ncbi:DEAD/DEAH box helicase [Evansella sp. LMS18]|uniref:DNA repair helicase XPB n=1 Tax=Evansella sp. LMS18 TaxID=2924033 RepID=UPI0020D1F049|nr:DNA repair helicase XPB [Evansella sp. LMS18]UTR10994.1 DEAD/DEAH box helicase [Evansella sp. LMS18]
MHHTKYGKPLTIQDNGIIFLRPSHPESKIVQPFLSQFSQLVKTPEGLHIYKLSSFSVWYALELGITIDEITNFLAAFSPGKIPGKIRELLSQWGERAGVLSLNELSKRGPCLVSTKPELLAELFPERKDEVFPCESGEALAVSPDERGELKRILMEEDYPVADFLGIDKGERLKFKFQYEVKLRPYQVEAANAFLRNNGGNGFIILPCGSGKTITGIGIMEKVKEATLIIVPNETALRQWKRELLEKTTLTEREIGIYTSERKEVRPVTITTYQMLTYRNPQNGKFPHFQLFYERNWGLVIYDEVHLLPAPLFRIVSNLQGKRRAGLTATFVREDGKERDIYSLVGPKKYEVSMKELENNGWIAQPVCREIKVPFSEKQWENYLQLKKRERFRYASENERKLAVLEQLIKKHKNSQLLIIGQYIDQLKRISEQFHLPLLTGQMKQAERDKLYTQFRQGEVKALVLSRVANLAVDLPDAQMAIQVSGTYGSRQEEAQRIGRLLRPKKDREPVVFYSLVTPSTQEEEVAGHRQLFMAEQGYIYEKEEWSQCSLLS